MDYQLLQIHYWCETVKNQSSGMPTSVAYAVFTPNKLLKEIQVYFNTKKIVLNNYRE